MASHHLLALGLAVSSQSMCTRVPVGLYILFYPEPTLVSNCRDLRVGEEGLQEGHSITIKFFPVQGSDAFRVKLKSQQCRQHYYQATNTLV